jgi:hypothetical protein
MERKVERSLHPFPLARRVDALLAGQWLVCSLAAREPRPPRQLLSKLLPPVRTQSDGYCFFRLSLYTVFFETTISHHQNYASPRIMGARSCCPLLSEQARTYPDTFWQGYNLGAGLPVQERLNQRPFDIDQDQGGRPFCSRRPPRGISATRGLAWSWMCSTSAAIGAMSSHVPEGSTWDPVWKLTLDGC